METLPELAISQNWAGETMENLEETYPELMESVKENLQGGKMDFVGGTFSQPHGFMFGPESNILQLKEGINAIKKVTGFHPTVFSEEEPYFHPQMPQILNSFGYEYAFLYFKKTVTDPHIPDLDVDPFWWEGVDGS